MDQTSLAVENLSFRYPTRGKSALRNVSFELRRGQLGLLLGPSGSGKSTLALCLNGLIPHEIEGEMSGRVIVNGQDASGQPVSALARQVGIVFQDPESQFCTLSVEEEIAFGLENLCLDRAEIDRRISSSLEQLDLAHLRCTPLNALSGGEKQKVAIVCALAMGCRILVLDEPTANLDPASTAELFRTLLKMRDTGEFTILVIEHKLDQLAGRADVVIALSGEGEVLDLGTPDEILIDRAKTLREHGICLPSMAQASLAAPPMFSDVPASLSLRAYAASILGRLRTFSTSLTSFPEHRAFAAEPETAKGPHLSAHSLSYRYGRGTLALDDATLSIDRGDFAAILGANGSGKTTLALALAGLIKPSRGTVLLDGQSLSSMKAKQIAQQVGLVFQNPEHQLVTDTVCDEIAFGPRMLHWPKQQVEARTEELLRGFGLHHLAMANPFTLSQGQRRRLSVASMLAVGQRALILDEPTYGQDALQGQRLAEQMRELNERGSTIVAITHDMALAAECASHVVLLSDGKVLAMGHPRDVFGDARLLESARLDAPAVVQLCAMVAEQIVDFPVCLNFADFWRACSALVESPARAMAI